MMDIAVEGPLAPLRGKVGDVDPLYFSRATAERLQVVRVRAGYTGSGILECRCPGYPLQY